MAVRAEFVLAWLVVEPVEAALELPEPEAVLELRVELEQLVALALAGWQLVVDLDLQQCLHQQCLDFQKRFCR